jgi:hypothetical protein
MSKIPTAEDFLIRENLPIDILSGDDINYAMIEFAKLHVEAALLAAEEEVDGGLSYVYPLENIK